VVDFSPRYRITANGADITTALMERSASITITDEAGIKSDSLDVTLDDDGIQVPSQGAELQVYMGYEGGVRQMGLYVVDEVELSGPPNTLKIKALGAPLAKSNTYTQLQEPRSRSWTPATVGDMVKTIATEHGLKPAVSAALIDKALEHIDQTDESDMHLLTRLAQEHDAIAKANGGSLLFVEKGKGQSTTGQPMPRIVLVPADVTRWSVKLSGRGDFKRVIARWRNVAAAQDIEEAAGAGEPVYRIRSVFPDQKSAQRAAQARLQTYQRGAATVSVTMPGRPDLVAESRVILSGFRSGVDGEWSVTRVTHSLSPRGYTTSVTGEVP